MGSLFMWKSRRSQRQKSRVWSLIDSKRPGRTILRNLSRHEYVRHDALEKVRGKYERVTWGSVLLCQICRSTFGDREPTGVSRGVWAGERFDIISADALDHMDGSELKDGKGETVEWKDVSDETMKVVEACWKHGW